jgi:hypothetical protein
MVREDGKISFPIWLLGDSELELWRQLLDKPFDARHPIRHNIWTSILGVIQGYVFKRWRTSLILPPYLSGMQSEVQ